MIAVKAGRGFQGRRIGTGIGLGQAVGAQQLTAGQSFAPLFDHRRTTETGDHPAHHVMDRDVSGGGSAAHGQLLENDTGIQPAKAQATHLFGGIERAETQLASLLQYLDRENGFLIPLGCIGFQFILCERPRHVGKGDLVFVQFKIHSIPRTHSVYCYGHGGRINDASAAMTRLLQQRVLLASHYFNWIVMFGPDAISSSNQRAVTVLVSV